MGHDDLRALLAQLHKRLQRSPSLDADSREMLVTVANDIEHALTRNESPSSREPKLEALAVRFEADHPALADVLRQIVDALAKAGI
jgi:hypothetical protein